MVASQIEWLIVLVWCASELVEVSPYLGEVCERRGDVLYMGGNGTSETTINQKKGAKQEYTQPSGIWIPPKTL